MGRQGGTEAGSRLWPRTPRGRGGGRHKAHRRGPAKVGEESSPLHAAELVLVPSAAGKAFGCRTKGACVCLDPLSCGHLLLGLQLLEAHWMEDGLLKAAGIAFLSALWYGEMSPRSPQRGPTPPSPQHSLRLPAPLPALGGPRESWEDQENSPCCLLSSFTTPFGPKSGATPGLASKPKRTQNCQPHEEPRNLLRGKAQSTSVGAGCNNRTLQV